jgi:hypothetical protein
MKLDTVGNSSYDIITFKFESPSQGLCLTIGRKQPLKEDYFLYNGDKKQPFTLPSRWTVREFPRFPETHPRRPWVTLSKGVGKKPIGTRPLFPNGRKDMTVAIIVDDPARATPIARMLPPVLEELDSAGIAETNISIVVALGTHRPASLEELEKRWEKVFFKIPGGST